LGTPPSLGRNQGFLEREMNGENRRKIEDAGRIAIECRRKGFHCSESVFTAVNETLKITDPSMVRMVTGFHGGRTFPPERTNAPGRNCHTRR
jgi:hypothetical protein